MAYAEIKQQWNAQADVWLKMAEDPHDNFTSRAGFIAQLIVRHVPGGTSLDVGCAAGPLSFELARQGFDVYGVDISESMIEKARQHLSSVVDDVEEHFRPLQDGKIPFEGRQFDVVAAVDVMGYIEDHPAYIRMLAGFVRPGGVLVACTNNRRSLHVLCSMINILQHRRTISNWRSQIGNLRRTGLWSGGGKTYDPTRQAYSAACQDRFFRQAGLTKVDEMNWYHMRRLDRRPFQRGAIGNLLARHLGWNHVGIYRKPG